MDNKEATEKIVATVKVSREDITRAKAFILESSEKGDVRAERA
jgi:hypothetical protein